MLRPHFVAVSALLAAGSCEAPLPPVAEPAPPAIRDLPLDLMVRQRTTATIPGADDRLSIAIGDITRQQVVVRVLPTPAASAEPLLGPVSMRVGASATFPYRGSELVLTLRALDNAWIGADAARFTLTVPAAKPTEAQRIERLIDAVAKLQGATFLRNGDEHPTADAVAHLRRKLAAGGDRITTAESFIEHAATRSSLSGQDYQVRLADGRVVRLADFLRERLAAM